MSGRPIPDTGLTPSPEVQSVPVMGPGERFAFVGLTVLAAGTILAFLGRWLMIGHSEYLGTSRPAFILASLLLLFHLGSWFSRWLLLWRMRRPVPLSAAPGLRVAVVTTFVPHAEPVAMLEQSLRAMVAMDYPHDTWVLDEGDSPEVAALCQSLGVRHYTRKHTPEFQAESGPYARATKYGNYNAWLREVGYERYDVLAAFDPDHIPEPVFLERVLGYFRDPRVGYVQAPQCYYNQDASFIARGAAEESYSYYSSHQMASFGMGQPILVGSHNAQRIAALKEVGGFAPHDADDLLITLRYRAKGWRGVYVPEILVLGTTPVDWRTYLRQQVRWTKSVIDLKLRVLPRMVKQLPPAERFLSLFHGAYYLRAFAVPVTYLLFAFLLMRGTQPLYLRPLPLAFLAGLMVLLGSIGLFRRRFSLDPAREGGVHWRASLLQFAKWPYQCLATWRALWRPNSGYTVTIKLMPASQRRLTLWPHWLIAEGMAVALATGIERGAGPTLLSAGVAVIAGSALIAALEFRTMPPPWEPHLYAARRAGMSSVIGPPRIAVEEPSVAKPPVGISPAMMVHQEQ